MSVVRDFLRYLFGLAFCAAAFVVCWVAWAGLDDMFGWRLALGGVIASIVVRLNFPAILGLYFYAYNGLGWPQTQSIAFAAPGLLIIAPGVAREVFGLLVGMVARR